MNIDRSIFKTYDIRGIYPDQLSAEGAYAIGRAYATFLLDKGTGNNLRVAVGGDMRHSTPELKDALISGLLDTGISVDDVGLVSTPTLYFAAAFFGYDGGIQVSASHNPKEWNGFKFTEKFGRPVSRHSGIDVIENHVVNDTCRPLTAVSSKGILSTRSDVLHTLVKDQSHFGNPEGTKLPALSIAVDAGSGMGSEDMRAIFKTLPHTIHWLNETLDGTFPVHEADPMVAENNEELCKTIREKKCDLGIAIDGDGDRYFFFDEEGVMIPQAVVRGLMAEMVLRNNPGATIVYDVRPGRITRELIEQAGGKPVLAPVGHSLIKEAMIREDAAFGGESSGHFFYALPYGTFEAPVVLILNFLRWLSEHPGKVSEVMLDYLRYANSGEINTKLESREAGLAIIEKLSEKYHDAEHHTLDGLTVEYPDFWFNVRLSNTGGATLRLILEAHDEITMMQKRDEVLTIIRT